MRHQGSHDAIFDLHDDQRVRRVPVDEIVRTLRLAALARDAGDCNDVAAQAIAAGMSGTMLQDVVIPAVARDLGVRWSADNLAFVDVTIATARLQSLVRGLEASRRGAVVDTLAAEVCVVVPAGVQHTLGATVLVAQLRERGHAVRFLLGATASDVARSLQRDRPAAVFISAIALEKLEILQSVVEKIRRHAHGVHVAIGGPSIMSATDMKRATGADHVGWDVDDALMHCGLTARPHNAKPAEMIS